MTRPLGIAALLLLMPVAGAAQEPISVSAGAGFDFPSGAAAEVYGRGINMGAHMTVPVSPRLAVRGGVGFWKLGRDDDAVLARHGRDPAEFRLGGGFFDGGDRETFAALAEGQLNLVPSGAVFAPYLFAGGGLARTEATEMETYFLGASEFEAGASETTLAADAGVGAELRLSEGVWLFGEVGYLTLFTDGATTAMIPARLGLSVHLGGR